MNLDEKKEMVVESYSKTLDKEMAYTKAGLTEEEKVALEVDPEFQERLKIFLINERENIISNFRKFMDSEDEKVSYKATTDFARVVYPDFFNAPTEDDLKSKKNSLNNEKVQHLMSLLSNLDDTDVAHIFSQAGIVTETKKEELHN